MEKFNVKMARCFTLQNLWHISSKELSAARCIGVTASSPEAVGSGCALHLKSPRTPSMRHSSNASSFNKTNILRWTFKQLPQKHKTNISKIHISLVDCELKHRNASIKCMKKTFNYTPLNARPPSKLFLHAAKCNGVNPKMFAWFGFAPAAMYSSWDGFWEARKKIRRSQGIPKLPAFKSCTMNQPSIDGMSNLPNCKAQLLVFTGTGRLCVDLALSWKGNQNKQSVPQKKILLDLYILFLAFYFEWKSRKKSAWPVQKRTAMHSNVGDALSLFQKVSWV